MQDISNVQESFLFLGYDIRKVYDINAPLCNTKKEKIYSVDLSICERAKVLTDFDYDHVGTEKTLQGIALTFEYAVSTYRKISSEERDKFEIIGLSVDQSSLPELKVEELSDKGMDIRWNSFKEKIQSFIGFDIVTVEYEWISGLMNCGIDIPYSINEYCLLKNYNDALLLKNIAEDKIKEHSPFCIWGIWKVDFL